MIKCIEDNLIGLLISIILLGFAIMGCLIVTSNKYENDIAKLQKENKELMTSVESLYTQLNNAYDCDCDFGVQEYEKGYIIDGYYYELKEQVGEE